MLLYAFELNCIFYGMFPTNADHHTKKRFGQVSHTAKI